MENYTQGESCERCDYACQHPTHHLLQCKKRAPADKTIHGLALWPIVGKDDWCGDFKLSREIAFNGEVKR